MLVATHGLNSGVRREICTEATSWGGRLRATRIALRALRQARCKRTVKTFVAYFVFTNDLTQGNQAFSSGARLSLKSYVLFRAVLWTQCRDGDRKSVVRPRV